MRKNRAIMTVFPSVSAAFCLELLYFVSCRQVVSPSYCCSAVSRSLIAKPPPFLGVSSLNLAALRSGHFFCLGLLASGFVAPSLMDIWSTSLGAPAQRPKSLRQIARNDLPFVLLLRSLNRSRKSAFEEEVQFAAVRTDEDKASICGWSLLVTSDLPS